MNQTDASLREVVLPSGIHLQLPMRCLDWSGISASFTAPVANVQKLLPSTKLKPMMILPGKAIVTLGAIEYRRMADVSAYNEFVVSVPVQYEPVLNIPGLPLLFHPLLSLQRYRNGGIYIHRLPVTTREACEAGIEVWGYPKSVVEIDFEETDQFRRARLRAGENDEISLEVAKAPTKVRSVDFYTYSVKGGALLRTLVQTKGDYGISYSLGGASCTLGTGPMADELRALGLGTLAFGRVYSPALQSLVHPGEVMSVLDVPP
jgi:hypothetical protein